MNTDEEYDLPTLAQRITYARDKLRGMSQEELADAVGYTQQAVFKVENGETLKPRWLYEASRVLKVNYDWLSSNKGKPNDPSPDEQLEEAMEHLGSMSKDQLKNFMGVLRNWPKD